MEIVWNLLVNVRYQSGATNRCQPKYLWTQYEIPATNQSNTLVTHQWQPSWLLIIIYVCTANVLNLPMLDNQS